MAPPTGLCDSTHFFLFSPSRTDKAASYARFIFKHLKVFLYVLFMAIYMFDVTAEWIFTRVMEFRMLGSGQLLVAVNACSCVV